MTLPAFLNLRRLEGRIVALFLALLLVVQLASFTVIRSSIERNAGNAIAAELKTGERVLRRLLARPPSAAAMPPSCWPRTTASRRRSACRWPRPAPSRPSATRCSTRASASAPASSSMPTTSCSWWPPRAMMPVASWACCAR
jgi:hypothetical protein